MHDARLRRFHEPNEPAGILLLLHGGQQRSSKPVETRHASWWRMALQARALSDFAEQHALVLILLKYRVRGWNDHTAPDPVADARWALRILEDEHPGVPIALVGHSMGGRTACRVADDSQVAGVCALAPWLPENEPVSALKGRQLFVIHGTRDRWTSARWSREYVNRAQKVAVVARWHSLRGVGHFMLRRVDAWNQFVKDSVSQILTLR